MKISLFRLTAFLLLTTSLCFGFERGNELINIPSAKMEKKGFMESGVNLSSGYRADTGFENVLNIFLRIGFLDNFEYGLTEEKNKINHHFQYQL